MTPDTLADLCARAYRHLTPWNAAQFADTLARPEALLTCTDHAFVLGQVILDEAEILALATDPDQQRSGQASAVLAAFHTQARARGAARVFLEVSTDNTPALRFYEGQGYRQVGRRKGYYRTGAEQFADALIMARDLP
ncbi:ribosomal protein S18-alanine N-acetyltransferase [Tropicibacter oceani]|uniref:[Ribosomal protein bS18]-alanine N-acetyltransferase n=1 Tax=Tropicibacter oceani TaxID=3058420 RepID=A0ABY8QJA5_9RHOB|nr:ribosomal protein S18-alanine N-acetyltransferase [Tropicibacter oceani]WGW04073.1 ribosomal protein S18-alanine N-acetyltransferase [Tropicibacter oceani]